MKSVRGRNPEKESMLKRKLKAEPLLILVGILLLCNVIWFIAWLIPNKMEQDGEKVASVGKVAITRGQWMTAMEKEVGREVLLDLVNENVMEAAAKKYKINVKDKEIDLELALIRSVDGLSYTDVDEEKVRKMIRSDLILEKVLTKDVVIKDKAIKSNYDENKSLYNLPTSYRTAIIVLPSKDEAEQALGELSGGSSFDVLAKERSVDVGSANLSGDIGYINDTTQSIDQAIVKTAAETKAGKVSGVIELEDGTFAIIRVSDIVKGRSFKFKEVSEHIRRELALEQLPESINPEAFWKEFDAKWFYGK
ncbi:peptidyl-prolyl cis-trans isomerase [Sporosarcina sp. G11-34]|uniref:peptidyl-prolyl cis-trans isomerase n=1 Tax=Sporosarcina sp. G11-34 TaxID=2849605 RepID=UPI0022A9D3B3|nr:peptidyl-prolyl cis-trans isomerase [Sporosarcina sp. G11-34]MCZ2260591.1 peptidyl-prolyl cis-trans isomerase [Sporosarcina sp. G11-34]